MAMRYLATKVGVPVLRRASDPRMSASAACTTRPLTSGSNRYQGGHNNGAGVSGARKPAVQRRLDVDPEFAAIQAQFEANRELIKKAIREKKINDRLFIGSGVAAVAFTWAITEPGLII